MYAAIQTPRGITTYRHNKEWAYERRSGQTDQRPGGSFRRNDPCRLLQSAPLRPAFVVLSCSSLPDGALGVELIALVLQVRPFSLELLLCGLQRPMEAVVLPLCLLPFEPRVDQRLGVTQRRQRREGAKPATQSKRRWKR